MPLNVFTAIARLGADAELRHTADGKAVAGFNAAVDCGWGDNKSTLWVRCNLWGKQAESVAPFLKKGGQVGITGELSSREWEDKEGQKRTSLELRISELQLLGEKPKTGNPPQSSDDRHPHPPEPKKKPAEFDDLGDDIPF